MFHNLKISAHKQYKSIIFFNSYPEFDLIEDVSPGETVEVEFISHNGGKFDTNDIEVEIIYKGENLRKLF